ncbi:limbic system-associated membrane protein-like [Euwallacea fornicatus]|uniref:limbic system-associated membrane protein-like n=1 Tax=Euwallacea fornicatus TaxID=995702 RepID=UPI00338F9F35
MDIMEFRVNTVSLSMIVFLLSGFMTENGAKRIKGYRQIRERNIRSYVAHSLPNVVSENHHETVFITQNSSSVVAQMGGTARLPCIVRKSNNGVVSWIRKNGSPPTILTVGLGTYIADDRFLVEQARHLQNWGLVIKHVQMSDSGTYECQVSLHPTSSIFIDLKVIEAVAEISGAPDLHIRAGSELRIVCRLRHSTEPPAYVFWYHDHRMINHDPGVQVSVNHSESILTIDDVDSSFSGNYTCCPSNTNPAYVNVHVLNATEEENPAAMMHNGTCNIYLLNAIFCLLASMLIFCS